MTKLVNDTELELLARAARRLSDGFGHLPDFDANLDAEAIAAVLQAAADRMHDNYPYFHPLYAGQMLKPPHPVARIAYAMAMWINPNNHALDGSRASSPMEKECVADIGRMFGWDQALGHLTGGGTMANLEALWVAGRLHPGNRVVASAQAHYTHGRISEVLKVPFDPVGSDARGRMDVSALEEQLARGDVGTVVVTMGTTGLGAVDPLPEVLELQKKYGFRVHADAAYGGYFTLSGGLDEAARNAFDRLEDVDSIVVDPHKHGLQPYGCGCVLFRDPSVGSIYLHDSPYTYFSSDELHLGEISLECSRAGASAVALWATMQLLPLTKDGTFARDLDQCLSAVRDLHDRLDASPAYTPLLRPELDIVVYAVNAGDTRSSSDKARRVFDIAAEKDLHLALIELPVNMLAGCAGTMQVNSETITCLRSVLMKPEQAEWTARIVELLEASAEEA